MPHPLQEKSFYRTIIVGLGSTGLEVLKSFQSLWYENFANTNDSLVKLINIETDEGNRSVNETDNPMIKQIFISNNANPVDRIVDNITMSPNPFKKIIPEESKRPPWEWRWLGQVNWGKSLGTGGLEAGAGGVRAFGKLLLYDKQGERTQAEEIYNNVVGEVRSWESINSPGDITKKSICKDLGFQENDWVVPDNIVINDSGSTYSTVNPYFHPDAKVIVVGSLTGGTCSGIFMDIGYILQQAAGIDRNISKRMIGVFFIPPNDEQILQNHGIAYQRANANTFGSLYEIDKLRNRQIQNAQSKENMSMPYGLIYLVAPEYNIDNPNVYMKNISGLVDMTALRLFAYTLGFHSKADGDLVDQFIHDPQNYLFTFGVGAVIFPKFSLIEKGTSEVLRNFCERLVSQGSYLDKGSKRVDIQSYQIEKHVKSKVDFFAQSMLNNIKKDPENNEESILEWNKKWADEISKDPNQKKMFFREFSDSTGTYLGVLKSNYHIMRDRTYELFNEDLTSILNTTTNLIYVKNILNSYENNFKKLQKLLELQGCHTTYDNLKNIINEAIGIPKKSKTSIDFKELNNVTIGEVFENVALYNVWKFVKEDLIDYIVKIRVKVENQINLFTDKVDEYGKNVQRYDEKLQNDINLKPVVNVFFNGKDEDYDEMKKGYLGEIKTTVDWEDIGGMECVNAFWLGINNQRPYLNDIYKKVRSSLKASLQKYLHPENGTEFRIIDRVLDTEQKAAISEVFKRVNHGFIRQEKFGMSSITGHLTGGQGRIPRYLISDATNTELDQVLNTYTFLNPPGDACGKHSNALMEDMLIYSRDISSLEVEKIMKFNDLKEAFLKSNIASMDDETWQRIRLTLDGEIDYTLIERRKGKIVKDILQFISLFWFRPVKQPDGQINFFPLKGEYAIPTVDKNPDGSVSGNGCYLDTKGSPRLNFVVPESKLNVNLSVLNYSNSDLNVICRHTNVFKTMITLITGYTPFNEEGKEVFIRSLYKHYETNLVPLHAGEKLEEYYRKLFADYSGDAGFNIDTLRAENCLIGRIWNYTQIKF